MPHRQFGVLRKTSIVLVTAIFFAGCGDTSQGMVDTAKSEAIPPGTTSARTDSPNSGRTRAVRWNVLSTGRRSIQIGAFVPYCEGDRPKPQVARVDQDRRGRKITLVLFVRFPRERNASCVGYDLGLSLWVALGKEWRNKSIYDGHSSPPALRIRSHN